jgi:hypothetical protein
MEAGIVNTSLSAHARRHREITQVMIAEQGGIERCPEGRHQLIRRFAAAACWAEEIEAQAARGHRVDVKAHALLTSTMVRIAQCIGIDFRAETKTPSLHEYLAAKTEEVESVK